MGDLREPAEQAACPFSGSTDRVIVSNGDSSSGGGRQSDVSVFDAERLMLRVAKRDAVAFESLYESFHRLVFGMGLRLLGDAASAEDLTQTVFLKVWTNPNAFKGGSLVAWISRVTRNGGLDVLRRRSVRGETHIAADVPVDETFEDAVIAGVDAQRVRNALSLLPSKERLLIEMGYFGGLTYHRVAAQTGVPLGTVKTCIRSGLLRLRDTLADGFDRAC